LLARFAQAPETLILYEAPHRLRVCLDDLLATLGDRQATLARELTKVHEEFRRGRLTSLRAGYDHGDVPRGEFTIVISGAELAVEQETAETLERRAIERIQTLLASGASVREAATEVAHGAGLPRRQVYRLALEVSASRRISPEVADGAAEE
jgi:16S rRNA (cytidine1402-2'-O)-methyltransferase